MKKKQQKTQLTLVLIETLQEGWFITEDWDDEHPLISVIVKGSYEKVILVKHKMSKEIYAIKILKKKYIEKKR